VSADGSRNADALVQRTYEDFIRLQEDLKQSSKLLEKATQEMFPLTLKCPKLIFFKEYTLYNNIHCSLNIYSARTICEIKPAAWKCI
jgi:hypothetical protein